MGKSVLESEEGKEATRAYNAIMTSLQEYEKQHVEEWSREIENTSQEKLKQSLLRKEVCPFSPLQKISSCFNPAFSTGNTTLTLGLNQDDSAYIRVNFDAALVCLLREVTLPLLGFVGRY